MKSKLPTREEINVHNSLDEQSVCDHFLGKTLDEAAGMFRENFLTYQEDLMWMGPIAFQFYVDAAILYLKSSDAKGDSDAINCFLGLLEFRLKHEKDSISPINPKLAEACAYIVDHWNDFDVNPAIYGDLSLRFKELISTLAAI